MISTIVDSSGNLVYRGNERNPKFAAVLARPGHVRVDAAPPARERDRGNPVWDGTTWNPGAPHLARRFMSAEDVFDLLKAKGVVLEEDRPVRP